MSRDDTTAALMTCCLLLAAGAACLCVAAVWFGPVAFLYAAVPAGWAVIYALGAVLLPAEDGHPALRRPGRGHKRHEENQ